MEMKVNISLFFYFFLVFHQASAFNITQILTQYPDFSIFNNYLTQTNLASQINSRETITILAIENSNLSPLSGKPSQVLANILSVHVILDYFDVPKLQKLPNKSTTLTTLFQTTGSARGQQGFVNVTHLSTSSIAFGSAVAGSVPGSNLIKSVFSQPYNISVLQVSNAIVPPGIDGPTTEAPSASTGGGSPTPAGVPSASPGGGSQAPSMPPNMSPHVSPAAPPPTDPPTSSGASAPSRVPPDGNAPAGSVTPPTASPLSEAPAADAPAADGPTTEAPASDAPPSPSAGASLHIGIGVVYIVVGSSLWLASRI